MTTFVKFNQFPEDLAHGVHDLGSDQLVLALTDSPPAGGATLSDITEIDYSYCASRNLLTASSGQSGGIYTLVLADLPLYANGGSIGPFRYPVLYNDSSLSPADALLAWADLGTEITVEDGEHYIIDMSQVAGLFTLT